MNGKLVPLAAAALALLAAAPLAQAQPSEELDKQLSISDGWQPGDERLQTPGKERAGRTAKARITRSELELYQELSKSDGWQPGEIVLPPRESEAIRQMAGIAAPAGRRKDDARDLFLYSELSKSDGWSPGEVVLPSR
ncbi:MAG: hypothetical protein NDJ89_12845 [Oligoflexia bacterium]|nr:hypothetical protein [Oligoflexia bacterium]